MSEIPTIDAGVIARYRKVLAMAESPKTPKGERDNAARLLIKLERQHPDIVRAVEEIEHDEAVQRANEEVARRASVRAAAMGGFESDGSPKINIGAADQIAYWSNFVESTIANIAAHPDAPVPSAAVFVETIDLGPPGKMATTIKRTVVRGLASWADRQIAERVVELRKAQRDIEAGKIPKALRTNHKRRLRMAKADLEKRLADGDCDVALDEAVDTDTNEDLFKFEIVLPMAMWTDVVEYPDVFVAFLNEVVADTGDTDEEEADEDDEEDESGEE